MTAPALLLVVEDDALVAWALRKAASARAVAAHVAGSGAEALALVRAHEFGLAFVDIGLPDVNGLELLPRIQEASPTTKVVVITGDGTPEVRERALEAGAAHFVEKPVELAEVSRLIDLFLLDRPGQRVHTRRACRFDVRLELVEPRCETLRRTFVGTALDLSPGGMRVETIYPLQPGQVVHVRVSPPAEAALPQAGREAVARVVWTRRCDEGITAGVSFES